VHRPESLVPGVPLPKREPQSSGMDVIKLIQERLLRPDRQLDARPGREDRLDLSPLRTPLDQLLVQGVFRDSGHPGAQSFQKIVGLVAPALIDGIEVENDSMYLAEHQPDFRHFVTRLVKRYQADPAGFGGWLRRESEKGFTRLLPGFKRFDRIDQETAREKGRRFYRRLLWTAYEAMSRCYGAAALWVWVSFCRSGVVAPSVEEQRAFRWYNAPLVCTGGLPLWFFGTNLLRWVLEPFIKCVWGLRPDQEFDALTRLIGLYGQVAAERRQVDAGKKRRANAAGDAALRAGDVAEQYEETADGRNIRVIVPTVQPVAPRGESATTPLEYTESTVCPCGGRMFPAIDGTSGKKVTPTVTDREILVIVECVECGKELTFRTSSPSARLVQFMGPVPGRIAASPARSPGVLRWPHRPWPVGKRPRSESTAGRR